jgi:hypothetical protein
MAPLRIVQWGIGEVGAHSLRFVLDSPDLELVGARCGTEAKVGKDAGDLVGRPSTGVLATQDTAALLALEPDCVLYMPRDTFLDPTVPGTDARWVEDVALLLENGANVVSPLQSAMHWRQLADGASLRARFAAAAEQGGSTVFFTGLDPGFVSDCLGITVSSAASAIEQIRTLEVIDYDTYGSPATLSSMGFGQRADDLSDAAGDSLVPSWGCALWLVADSLGVELDDIVLNTESAFADGDFVSVGGLEIAAGSVAGMQWSLTGVVRGKPLIVAQHVARMRADVAPDWPRIGEQGGYRVEVDGAPPLRVEMPLGLPGGTGTCLGDAVVMTAARCVNAVSAVVAAPPGYRLLNEMPPIGPRHALSGR